MESNARHATNKATSPYASVAGSSEMVRKAHVIPGFCVTAVTMKTRGTELENVRDAKYVEDGLPVTKSGAVKTLEKCGNHTV